MNLPIHIQLPWHNSDPSLITAFNEVQNGMGTIYEAAKSQADRVIKLAGMEKSVRKINGMVREHAEVVFWAVAALNIWQHSLIFAGGAVVGLATSALGKKTHFFKESIQVLKTHQALTEYNYISAIMLFVLSSWLCSFQSGFVAGNYLGNPTPINIQSLNLWDKICFHFKDAL